MKNVFHLNDDISTVNQSWLDKLKDVAYRADNKRARLCLHASNEDPLHEMVIVFHKDTDVRAHRHLNKTETFHHIFGEIDVLIFDDGGSLTRSVQLRPVATAGNIICRIPKETWHQVKIISEFAAIHEITNGPFNPEASEIAPWARG